jgi:hypothetical protein
MAVSGLVKVKARSKRVDLQDEAAFLYSRMRRKSAGNAFAGLFELSTISHGSTRQGVLP